MPVLWISPGEEWYAPLRTRVSTLTFTALNFTRGGVVCAPGYLRIHFDLCFEFHLERSGVRPYVSACPLRPILWNFTRGGVVCATAYPRYVVCILAWVAAGMHCRWWEMQRNLLYHYAEFNQSLINVIPDWWRQWWSGEKPLYSTVLSIKGKLPFVKFLKRRGHLYMLTSREVIPFCHEFSSFFFLPSPSCQ